MTTLAAHLATHLAATLEATTAAIRSGLPAVSVTVDEAGVTVRTATEIGAARWRAGFFGTIGGRPLDVAAVTSLLGDGRCRCGAAGCSDAGVGA